MGQNRISVKKNLNSLQNPLDKYPVISRFPAQLCAHYETGILHVFFVSSLQSPCQFIRSQLNEPQRKPLIKVRSRESERASERARSSNVHTSEIFNETNRIHGGRREYQVELSRSRNRHDYTQVRERRKQKKKLRKAKRGKSEQGRERVREARRDEDALLLAPAGDVRRNFLFGPAQPRGSPLLFYG